MRSSEKICIFYAKCINNLSPQIFVDGKIFVDSLKLGSLGLKITWILSFNRNKKLIPHYKNNNIFYIKIIFMVKITIFFIILF